MSKVAARARDSKRGTSGRDPTAVRRLAALLAYYEEAGSVGGMLDAVSLDAQADLLDEASTPQWKLFFPALASEALSADQLTLVQWLLTRKSAGNVDALLEDILSAPPSSRERIVAKRREWDGLPGATILDLAAYRARGREASLATGRSK